MRKLYIALTLFLSAPLFAGQVVTVSRSISDLATQYGWNHDTCYLSFQLDDAITITGTKGNAKYCKDKTAQSLRYYQNCLKGEFAIQAREGVTIQSIKLTYIQQMTNSVAAVCYVDSGKSVPDANQVKTDITFPVKADKITLYVGRSDAHTGGQIRIKNIEVTYVTSGESWMLTKTTQELANQYGWGHETCLRQFDLNDVLVVDVDSAGTMKYNMNTKQMHCYQWLGAFTIRAKEGCTIKSVKLSYHSVRSGVLTQNWGTNGQNIPESDRVLTNQTVDVNASSVTFYVGSTGTNTDAQIRIEKWQVEYTQPKTSEVMTRATIDLAKQYGWSDATCPVNVVFNNALSFHSDSVNNVKFYNGTKSFHCYQWCGGFYFKSRPGTMIKSVALYYDAIKGAVLTQNWGSNGKNIPEYDWIASGAIVPVNADSVHFFTGDKSDAKSQIHITGFLIEYIDSLSTMETFASCPETGSDAVVSMVGDKGLYHWQLSKFERSTSDCVGSSQGTRLLYEGVIATDGVQEGGIKDVSFEWRTSEDASPVHFVVTAGDTKDDYKRANAGSNYIMNYTKELAVKRNCAFAVSVGSQDIPAQSNPIIGPITITPYLLFKVPNHADSIDTNCSAYDLKPLLINNSVEMPQFEIVSNSTGDTLSIANGEMDLSAVKHAGDVKVKAWCMGGDVYTTLNLHIGLAPKVYFAAPNVVANLNDSVCHNPLIVPDSIGAITYSSSDTKVAMVNDTGLVTIIGIGQAVITAHIAASDKYVAISTSYTLSVVYTPAEGTYRVETFTPCKKKNMSTGFVYLEGDNAIYDWNLSNFSRDKQDRIGGKQGIRLYYSGTIASNGEQEGGIKYLSFNWRAVDPVLPVHFVVDIANTSMSYGSAAVGDTSLVYTYSSMVHQKSNTSLSIGVRAKENPAQSQIIVGPLLIMPYLLFTNKYVELELPQTTYDCAGEMINNTDGQGEITFSIVSNTADTAATIEGSVLNLSAITKEETIQVQATWGEVKTTMMVHLMMPTGLNEVHNGQCTMHNGKVMVNGELRIWHNGAWWTVMGEKMHNAQCTMHNE